MAYEGLVAMAAKQAMPGRQLIDGPVLVELTVVHGISKSMAKKRNALALAGLVKSMKKPDTENVLKATCDGCSDAVWRDDVQNTDGACRRR